MSNQTLVNSSPLAITYRDGRTETIKLKELTIRQLYQFIEQFAAGNSPALAALCAGQDDNWPDTLTDESFAAVVKEAIRLNFPRATTLIGADMGVAAKLAPTIKALMTADQLLAGELSKTKSPAPAASASPEATGNVPST